MDPDQQLVAPAAPGEPAAPEEGGFTPPHHRSFSPSRAPPSFAPTDRGRVGYLGASVSLRPPALLKNLTALDGLGHGVAVLLDVLLNGMKVRANKT